MLQPLPPDQLAPPPRAQHLHLSVLLPTAWVPSAQGLLASFLLFAFATFWALSSLCSLVIPSLFKTSSLYLEYLFILNALYFRALLGSQHNWEDTEISSLTHTTSVTISTPKSGAFLFTTNEPTLISLSLRVCRLITLVFTIGVLSMDVEKCVSSHDHCYDITVYFWLQNSVLPTYPLNPTQSLIITDYLHCPIAYLL